MYRPSILSLLILSMTVLSGTSIAQDPPPRNLHLEGDHWTAWTPPGTAPEGAQVYVIQSGDTFWSIAEQFLGDPHLWPQIWEQNQYILDSHWIYPGDRLIMAGAAVAEAFVEPQDVFAPPMDDAAVGDEAFFDGDEQNTPLDASSTGIGDPEITAPVPLGYESDIYCSGYIGAENEVFPFQIGGSEYDYLTPQLDVGGIDDIQGTFGKAETEKVGLGLGDIVYLEGGRADGLSAGELLTAVQPQRLLHHPKTDALLGRVYLYLGRLRVLSTQEDTAIAEITQLCAPMPVGSELKYFEPEPVPLRRITPLRPINFPARESDLEDAPVILGTLESHATGVDLLALGIGYLVVIDQGITQDVAPGDIYTIYRRSRRGFPPIVLGELGVLTAFEGTSLARILRSRYAVFTGDPLVLK